MQGRDLKMTNYIRDSFSNIRSQEEIDLNINKLRENDISHTNGPNRLISYQSTSNSISFRSQPPLIHEVDKVDVNMKVVERYQENIYSKEINGNPHPLDLNSFSSDVKNHLNFFSLPMYGICEKSTQTELTGRDIEDLDYFKRELSVSMNCLLKNNQKDKTEFMKKIFPFLEDKKTSNSLTLLGLNPLQTEIPSPNSNKNFIQIKRKSDNEGRSIKSKTLKDANTPNIYPYPHIHLKNKRQNQPRKKKKDELNTDHIQSSKEEEIFSLQKRNSTSKEGESTPFKLISNKKSANMLNLINEVVEDVKYSNSLSNQVTEQSFTDAGSTHLFNKKRDFTDQEFNISEIINDIKNSTRKEMNTIAMAMNQTTSQILNKKESDAILEKDKDYSLLIKESNTVTVYDSTNLHSSGTNANVTAEDSSNEKGIHNTKSTPAKDKIPKKFDAYYFFKCEFALSKPNLSHEELEKLCRTEWNSLDKETKKIYNINAEREKKILKLNKKIQQREQTQKAEEDIR